MICVGIGRTRHKMVILEHQALANAGAELVELRIDWLNRVPELNRLLNDRPTPTIVTCRRKEDYGRWKGSEDERITLLRSAIVAGVEFVDLEVDVAKKIPRYGKTRRIVSYHNFNETPDDLESIHKEMQECDADVIKIVTTANSPVDGVNMLQLVQQSEVPTVGFCMGEFGLFTRVLCGKFGSPFTYASFSSERELAPGQLSFKDMVEIYRYDEIDAETQVYGVIGDPVGHSLSPIIHNSALESDQVNAVYLPFRIPKHVITESIEALKNLGVKGFSVTIPHKEAVVKFAHHQDAAVKACGAANTLYASKSGAWTAANTDYDAAMATLRIGLGNINDTTSLEGKRVLMLGAGGVARAIGLGLIRAGAALSITNRTRERGETLAKELGCQFVQWENRGADFADVLINCTPIGMHPDINSTPFQDNWLREGMLVFDTIYTPENTLLLKQARERGCKTVSGLEMFVRQAGVQYECFTEKSAPLDDMRATLRKAISPVNL